ncbi:hypothetical protein HPP92_028613 [Vanilla planifolia]|uniref:Uncharacterized protein n=1 Tax=Vanilla planifolia TaxID=51239 RepID=A0A835P6V0_VANPL|nr:hypothetical protein HPP92_028613 [Vanilla planifolia]
MASASSSLVSGISTTTSSCIPLHPKVYRSLIWFAAPKLRQLELLVIASGSCVSITMELFVRPDRHQPLDYDFTIPSNHLQNFDHAFMSLTFLLYATFAAALDRANPARPAAEPLTILAASTAFAQGLLLFHLPPPTTLAWRPVPLAPSAGHRRLARHHSLGHQPPEELCGRIRSVLDHCLPGDMAHHHGIRPLYAVADVQGVLHQPRKRAHGGPMPKPGGAPPRQGAEYASIVKLVDDDVEDLDVEANMRSFVSMGKTMRSMDLEM